MIAAVLRALHGVVLAIAATDPLVVYMNELLPADDDVELRVELAGAIHAVTRDRHEQHLLARIARFESNYRRDVADCGVAGKEGELSSWQILPTPAIGREEICASFESAAAIALRMVRESIRICSHLPERERLALYTRGNCENREGQRLSRVRWERSP